MTNTKTIIRRRHYLDNLRSFLTCLVVVHHTGATYGLMVGWYYESSLFASATSPPVLMLLAINQSFFMGLFFWISGHFSAQSLERCGPRRFAKSKVIRLGIPAVVYTLLLQAITTCMVRAGWHLRSIGETLGSYYKSLRGINGPVWYTALLLVFDLVAAGIAQLRHRRQPDELDSKPALASSYRTLARWGWLGVAAASFLIRLRYSVGKTSPYIIAVQPAYVSQYIFAYILGYLAYFEDESRLVGPLDPAVRPAGVQLDPESETEQPAQDAENQSVSAQTRPTSRPALYLAGAFSICIGAAAFGALIKGEKAVDSDFDRAGSGWNLGAVHYALWNELSFITLGPAIMACFEAWHDRPTDSWIWKARYSYAAFLLHTPIIVALDMSVDKILVAGLGADKWAASVWLWKAFGPITLTVVLGVLGAALSFVVGRLVVEYVPLVNRAV